MIKSQRYNSKKKNFQDSDCYLIAPHLIEIQASIAFELHLNQLKGDSQVMFESGLINQDQEISK